LVQVVVRVTPRGGRDAIDGWTRDDAGRAILRIRVAAAAAEGAANAAVLALLAKALGVPKTAVRLASGQTARVKRVGIDGVDMAQLEQVLGKPPA
jgi:uncharacterized protein YggU (UPF0235/DUF167 family)